jgi:type II secretory ATPase GspE/PulE/Tfp pilus assembly ATPase PilB-like protein
MGSLRADGARKVVKGITSIEEVLRATEDEGVVAQI